MRQIWLIVLSAILLTVGVVGWITRRPAPDPRTVAATSLESLREQNRLSAFAARFVTVTTTRRTQMGLSAEKTLIVPATVRYEVDLSKLRASDLDWSAAERTLSVKLPPVELSAPEFDLQAVREYGDGAVLMALTDVERSLDAANREKARVDVLAQARAAPMLRMAEAAHVRAVESSFAMPLAAAGVEAKVRVTFRAP